MTILSSYDQDQSIIVQCWELVKHWLIVSNCISCWLIKSKVKRKPNARMSLPDNICTKTLKTSCLPTPPFSLFYLCHLAQLCSAGFLLKIWASIDGSKPFCLFHNRGNICAPAEAVSAVLLQCTVRPVSGVLGAHARRRGKHAASKEGLKPGSEK